MPKTTTDIGPKPSTKAVRLINKFMNATDAYAFRGASHPDSWSQIDRDYANSRKRLYAYIATLEAAQPKTNNSVTFKASENG